jgi:hypothetical protein
LYDQQQAIGKTLDAQRTALDNSRRVEDELRSQLASGSATARRTIEVV